MLRGKRIKMFYELSDLSAKGKIQYFFFNGKDGEDFLCKVLKLSNGYKFYMYKTNNQSEVLFSSKEFNLKDELEKSIHSEMNKLGFKSEINEKKEIIYTDKIKQLDLNELDKILNEEKLTYPEIRKINIQKNKILDKQKLEEAKSSLQIGDIFVSSWGYEQTNVDAYQVVEINGSNLKLREIALESITATSHDSDRVKPIKDSFIKNGEEIVKRLNSSGNISFDFSNGYKWNGKDTYHRSWGY